MNTNAKASRFSVFTDPVGNTSTVILGAGIVGSSIAYFLTESPATRTDTVHLIEAAPELFASASGKAGGFLASDWFGPASAPLGALSFELHKELADKHDGRKKWGYSRSTGASLAESHGGEGPRGDDWLRNGGSRAEVSGARDFGGHSNGPAWLTRQNGDKLDVISESDTVGQVDPLRLSQFLLQEALMRGVRLHHPAQAIHVSRDDDGNLSAVRIRHANGSEHKIPCTRLIFACGAWTPPVFEALFPDSPLDLPISQLAGHSVVVKSPRWTEQHESSGCHAVFTTMRSGFSPEIISRIGGEIYVAGLNDPSLPLPELPTDAKIDQASIHELKQVSQRLLGKDGTDVSDLEVLREGLCFRPVTRNGDPIISRIEDDDLGPGIRTKAGHEGGVFIAAGHGPWGISHSLGTGKVMAEILEGKKTSADVRRLAL